MFGSLTFDNATIATYDQLSGSYKVKTAMLGLARNKKNRSILYLF